MATKKKQGSTKQANAKPHWAPLDVRPKAVRERAVRWMQDIEAVHESLIHAGAVGASISMKPQDDGSMVGYLFLPVELPDTDTLGIRSSGIDMATCLASLMFKFTIMLPDYELPFEAEEDFDFT